MIRFFLAFGGLSPAEEPLLRISELDGSAGNVEKVNVVRGDVLLCNSAAGALKRWKFTPFAGVDNKPAKVIASLTFDFHLQSGL